MGLMVTFGNELIRYNPANKHPVAILPLGYPAEGCQPSERHLAYRGRGKWIKEL